MRQRIAFLTVFFGFLPAFILALILYSLYLLHATDRSHANLYGFASVVHYQALPVQKATATVEFDARDARVSVLEEFFTRYRSPLLPYAEKIVTTADDYGLDYRLIPSIAMQESNLCLKIPQDSYNCWGFDIYGGHVHRFANYDTAIETVTKTLALEYKKNGYTDPAEIMTKYTPSSNGSWAHSVTYFMTSLDASL